MFNFHSRLTREQHDGHMTGLDIAGTNVCHSVRSHKYDDDLQGCQNPLHGEAAVASLACQYKVADQMWCWGCNSWD